MKWCQVFQCWCDDVGEVVDVESTLHYCVGGSCHDCEAGVDVKGAER